MLAPVFNDLLRNIGDGPLHDNLVVFRVNRRVEDSADDGAILSRRLHGDDLVRSTILVSKPTERFNGPRLTCANRPPEGNRHLTGKEDAQKINGHSAFNSFHFTVYDTNLACVQVSKVRQGQERRPDENLRDEVVRRSLFNADRWKVCHSSSSSSPRPEPRWVLLFCSIMSNRSEIRDHKARPT